MTITVGSTMARVRAETALLHRRVEHDLDLFGHGTSWLDYRLYLFRMYGFHVPVEAMLGGVAGLAGVVADVALRNNKVPLLAHDLVALGVDRRDLAQLPRITLAACADVGEALGWMYVVEAATVDGKRVAEHLAPRLPLEIETASAYLRCYGDDAHRRWAAFGDAVDRYGAADPRHADRVVAAATEAYGRLHRWLRPTVPARGSTGELAVAGSR